MKRDLARFSLIPLAFVAGACCSSNDSRHEREQSSGTVRTGVAGGSPAESFGGARGSTLTAAASAGAGSIAVLGTGGTSQAWSMANSSPLTSAIGGMPTLGGATQGIPTLGGATQGIPTLGGAQSTQSRPATAGNNATGGIGTEGIGTGGIGTGGIGASGGTTGGGMSHAGGMAHAGAPESGTRSECLSAEDCPVPAHPCLLRTCGSTGCGSMSRAAGSPCASNGTCDSAGDCLAPVGKSYAPNDPPCPAGASCNESRLVLGGTFAMGRGGPTASDACPENVACTDSEERPEHTASVDDFYIDTFEVTVGRFRRFYDDYDSLIPIASDAGAHPRIAGSGWQSDWNGALPADRAALLASIQCSPSQTWTLTAEGASEQRPMNCVSWYVAFAFCIWDGGRLPTEAEWEYVAAAGPSNNLYPWGAMAPDATLANYVNNPGRGSTVLVGSFPNGRSAFGQYDLAGSMEEWILDYADDIWYSRSSANPCLNCANLTPDDGRITRGGSWGTNRTFLRAAARSSGVPAQRYPYRGIRCVRGWP